MKEDQAIVAEPASDDLESEAVLDKSPEVEVVEEAKEVRIILVAFYISSADPRRHAFALI